METLLCFVNVPIRDAGGNGKVVLVPKYPIAVAGVPAADISIRRKGRGPERKGVLKHAWNMPIYLLSLENQSPGPRGRHGEKFKEKTKEQEASRRDRGTGILRFKIYLYCISQCFCVLVDFRYGSIQPLHRVFVTTNILIQYGNKWPVLIC